VENASHFRLSWGDEKDRMNFEVNDAPSQTAYVETGDFIGCACVALDNKIRNRILKVV
jgi:hypothetical protein